MAAKFFFVVCASSLLVQRISAQCIGNALAAEELALAGAYGPGLAANSAAYGSPYGSPYGSYAGLAPGCGYNAIAPTSGGGFAVTSTSPISPTGISVVSENAIEGAISVIGELPFLGAVALEGALPTAGAGGINYGCGGGVVGIVSEGIAPAYGPAAAMGPGRYGYGAGFAGPGFAGPGFAGPGFAGPGFAGAGFAGAGLGGPGYGCNGLGAGYGFGSLY